MRQYLHPKQPKNSIAILNYHRIVADGKGGRFYDVEESTFIAQMSMLSRLVVRVEDGIAELAGGRRVCLTFDDGTEGHRTAAEILCTNGLVGTFFIVTGRLDKAGYLRSDLIADIAGKGHRIGSHTVNHRHLTDLSISEMEYELCQSRTILESLSGQPVLWLSVPGGYYSTKCLDAAREMGYQVVRTSDWGYTTFPISGAVPSLPVLPSYDLPMFQRLIDGSAPLWQFGVKNRLKGWLGEPFYSSLRNRISVFLSK